MRSRYSKQALYWFTYTGWRTPRRFMNLNQITLPSTDVRRSIEFYLRLGLLQIVEDLPSYARFECPVGDATLSVQKVDQLPESPGAVVYFECEKLDSAVARLQGRGVQFDSALQDQPWLWREAYLKDPDGNVLCLFQAGENRKNPPWRLGSGSQPKT
jgi:predicted enzyme related to lactoylglutathione lyase